MLNSVPSTADKYPTILVDGETGTGRASGSPAPVLIAFPPPARESRVTSGYRPPSGEDAGTDCAPVAGGVASPRPGERRHRPRPRGAGAARRRAVRPPPPRAGLPTRTRPPHTVAGRADGGRGHSA